MRRRSTGNYIVSVWSLLVINLCWVFLKFGRAPVGRAGAPQNVICRPRPGLASPNDSPPYNIHILYACVRVCLCGYNKYEERAREKEKAYAETPGAHDNRCRTVVLTFLLFRLSFAEKNIIIIIKSRKS